MISFQQSLLILNSITMSRFSNSGVIWVLWNINNRINRINEAALKMIYKDYDLSYQDLLNKENTVMTFSFNLLILVAEFFKIKIETAPEMINVISRLYLEKL